jgi:hypothetical protein
MRIRNHVVNMTFHVVETCANVLISYRDAIHATLIPEPSCDLCPEPPVEALSIYSGEVISLKLSEHAVPKNFPPRKVALALEDEVKAELQRMVNEGVIIEEREPTD